jgi:hypothetical protein
MKGIIEKPYIDIEQFIDMQALQSLHKEICYGIAQSTANVTIYGTGLPGDDRIKSFIDLAMKYKESSDLFDKEIFNNLDWNQKAKFFKLYEGMYNGSSVVTLRDMPKDKRFQNYFFKGTASATEFTENVKYFPNLIDWIYKLPVFREVGRIIFFMNEHGCDLQLHKDAPKEFPHREEFIWLNPTGKKKFFVYDEVGNVRHYIESKAAFFNSMDWHGGDAIPTLEYSLRIDGKFTEEFREQIGISHLETY